MKIICIGMNYAEHVEELKDIAGRSIPEKPVFFMKPDTALLRDNEPFYLPDFSNDLHYECEAVVKISRICKAVEERFAERYYDEIGLGIDFTARDLQRQCKEKGLPWEIAKAFDHSAVVGSPFIPKNKLGKNVQDLRFSLDINGQRKQSGWTGDMIFTVDRIISYVSQFVTLRVGDLIFTGTPVGVGQVHIGDRLTGTLEGQTLFDFEVK